MKHLNIRWNPATNEWFCAKCGRTSEQAVAKTDEGKPVPIGAFHDTVSRLSSLTEGFEVLRGVTAEQARTLVDSMNEKIVGVR